MVSCLPALHRTTLELSDIEMSMIAWLSHVAIYSETCQHLVATTMTMQLTNDVLKF